MQINLFAGFPSRVQWQRILTRDLIPALSWAMLPGVVFALVGFVALGPARPWDHVVSGVIQGPEVYGITLVGTVTQEAFSAIVTLGVCGLACIVLALRHRWLVALSLGTILPLTLLEAYLKYIIDQPPASSFLQVRILFYSPGGAPAALQHGFPSGHAARAVFLIGWLAMWFAPPRARPVVLAVAALVAIGVCWTRIYAGDHTLLEMAAGSALAIMFLIPAAALGLASRRHYGRATG